MNNSLHIPASFEQERAWVVDQMRPGNPAQNSYKAIRISGRLDRRQLQKGLTHLVHRHEILRTALSHTDASLVQVIQSSLDATFTFCDLSHSTSTEDCDVQQIATDFIDKPFDLNAAPLWRVLLVQIGPATHILVLCMHSAVCDGRATLDLFLQEMLHLYDAQEARGAENALPAAAQYRHHAIWQRALTRDVLAPQQAYWHEQLADNLEPTTLPCSGTRPLMQTQTGACHRRILPVHITDQIQRFSNHAGLSLSSIVMAGLVSLLYRYTGNSQVVLGHRTSSRHHDRAKNALGHFGNLAVMRINLTEGSTFEGVLEATCGSIARADDNQDYPFQHLVRSLNLPRSPSTTPLFQILFESDLDVPASRQMPVTKDLVVDDFEIHGSYVLYDLQVTASRFCQNTIIDFRFNSDLFSRELITQFATHFIKLISAAVEGPRLPLGQLSLLTESDRTAITQHWNTIRTPYRKACIHDLVEDQVARTPEAIAVEFHDCRLTYDAINRRANQMARHLMAMGVGKGDMVGLCMERSAEMIITILSIFKVGGAVVPLDPAFPLIRLRFMLADAHVRIAITAGSLFKRSPKLAAVFQGLIQVDVDEDYTAISQASEENVISRVEPRDVAYCIYTSGSTGLPKGVTMRHTALSNLIAWHRDTWLATVGTRTLLYSPISFDVSFHEIVVGLSTGATLVQIDEITRRNPIALLDFVRQKGIEKWYMPFVTLQQIAQVGQTAAVPTNLKEVIVGGEPLRITSAIRSFAYRTGCVVHNHYGSTECLDVATYTLSGAPNAWPSLVPIGRPNIYNTNVYVLDLSLQPVPIGVVGEIYADGDCLATGYHGRPDLTKERFVDNPFAIQGDRLYKTGDLGRYLPDGNIECIGRADQQVKIRGFRVELGEIEAVLAEHGSVAECVVTFKRSAKGVNHISAYVVAKPGNDTSQLPDVLRTFLAEILPEYMVPTFVVALDSLPLTPSGKVDVLKLPEPQSFLSGNEPAMARPLNSMEELIAQVWREILEVPHIDTEKSFFELGGDSLLLVRAHQKLADLLSVELSAVTLFKYPTIKTLAQFLLAANGDETSPEEQTLRSIAVESAFQNDIAIIGMSCRVPGAQNIAEFWSNLRGGVESISPLPESDIFRINTASLDDPHFVPAAAILPNIDRFDASFFGYSPAEAEVIDPQQRLFLECALEAIENAGIDPHTFSGDVGVYAGSSMSTYLINNVLPAKLNSDIYLSHRQFNDATELRIEQGNARDHLPMRVSYKLNLRGPSINIQSTCSTSLVAVHLACQALLNKQCDVAIAGGVSITVPQNTGYWWKDGMMLSSDGHCRAFDAAANGTVFGNGVGMVVLKPLHLAVKHRDHIYAVIKGSAVNNDGSAKVDYAGPNVRAQADVIAQAHLNAGISANEISYVEAHGTGTVLGDPIEIAALTEAFERTTSRPGQYCGIGSVKTNIGHLDEAAGAVGLIKTALALYHRELPASLNFREPNPNINFRASPFVVNAKLKEWAHQKGVPRRAGVSSFGMGGTNCHVVLEEPPVMIRQASSLERRTHVLPISAKSPEALRENVERYVQHLSFLSDESFADTCFSASTGRTHHNYRIAIVADTAGNACEQLSELLSEPRLKEATSLVTGRPPLIAFMFTGQGSQYAGMGRSLYETQPTFRAEIEKCDELLRPLIGQSLATLLFQTNPAGDLDETAIAQPALFSVGYALSQLWSAWGVTPDVLVGHSVGEYVAACVAGVFSLEDGLKLVAERGRLMQNLPSIGSMVQVNASAREVEACLRSFRGVVSIAVVNGPQCTVISGQREAVINACDRFREAQIEFVPLNVSHAFHSPLMQPMIREFGSFARQFRYSQPEIKIVSNITGEVATKEIASAEYWVRHILEPVQFETSLSSIKALGVNCFLELGPRPALINLGRRCLPESANLWLPSIIPNEANGALGSLKRLYLAGVPVNWTGFEKPFERSRIPVPTYAFQGQRYWLESQVEKTNERVPRSQSVVSERNTASSLPNSTQNDSQIYLVQWKPLSIPATPSKGRRWIVIRDSDEFATRLVNHLKERGEQYKEVYLHDQRKDHGEVLEVGGQEYQQVSLAMVDGHNDHDRAHVIFMLRPSHSHNVPQLALESLTGARNLLRAALSSTSPKSLWFVTRKSQSSEVGLSQSVLVGLARVANVEHPELNCAVLDLESDIVPSDLDLITSVICNQNTEEHLLLRKGVVYAPRLRLSSFKNSYESNKRPDFPINPDGTYLITGGTSGLGLELALRVAQQQPRRLVLISRSGKVPACDSATWAKIQELATHVEIIRVDVADETQLKRLIERDLQGDLSGIFHCAGSIDDGILLNQTTARCSRVLSPKVHGAWLLHCLTLDLPLDFFVTFSSTASLIGYGGQATYSAANAFLDALAHYRANQQLPTLSVSWGGWAGTGMTARLCDSKPTQLRNDGETLIDLKSGMDTLAALMQGDSPHVAVASMNWNTFAASRSRVPSIITSLLGHGTYSSDNNGRVDFFARLREAPSDQARRILQAAVVHEIRNVLGGESSIWIDPKMGFQDMGIDSLGAIDLSARLQSVLDVRFSSTLPFEHSCLESLVTHLEEEYFSEAIHSAGTLERSAQVTSSSSTDREPTIQKPSVDGPSNTRSPTQEPIAIIGMACRFPGAGNPQEFWKLLIEGRDTTRVIPLERWNIDDAYDPDVEAPGKMYVKRAALIDDLEGFDAAFFGISPREAIAMDPRHRLLLEVCWEAIEAAGIDPSSLRDSDTGVYLGCDEFINGYMRESEQTIDSEPYVITGNTLSFSAGRLSFKLGLHGPSMVIATACSSSLVALHTAVEGIRRNDCSLAVVGSAKLIFGPEETVQLCKLKALAPDGRSKVFSAEADGYGRGEGCGVVLLKRLNRALHDRDPILAVIRGTAVNHDGPSSGLTVPNGKSQSRVIADALKKAGVRPAEVTYVEAHGTGTQLGDPIEINALNDVFGKGRLTPLFVGSVKANIGHLEETAGIAGLIKVVLSLQNEQIPPQIHCETLNNKVAWNDIPLKVQRDGIDWPPGSPKIAGLSSFGMSGTNAHVVIESVSDLRTRGRYLYDKYIFTFSARNEEALRECASRFVNSVSSDQDPCDVAYTLNTGRRHEGRRLAVVAANISDLKQRLQHHLDGLPNIPNVYQGVFSQGGEVCESPANDSGESAVQALISKGDWTGLAKLWCAGFTISWECLYEGARPSRVALPTYPFEHKRMWAGRGTVHPEAGVPPRLKPRKPDLTTGKADTKWANVPGQASSVQPGDRQRDVLLALRECLASLLGMDPNDLEADTPFYALGADSLTFMGTIHFVQDRFQVGTSFQQLIDETNTLRKLEAFVHSQLSNPSMVESEAPASPRSTPKGKSFPSPPGQSVENEKRLSARQERFLAEFEKQYSSRTRASKDQATRDRPFLANCRMSPFQLCTKEMSYPIIARRSSGARIWDVDGNEYVDISMGYGVHLFGHQPPFLMDAIRDQVERGIHIGPQSDQAGKVAHLLCGLTGMSRVAFCNSGTEAVMGALRLARAATGRTKFVMFEGSYHGWSDGTLALPAGTRDSIPMTRGISLGSMAEVVVLEYGARDSLRTIETIAHELAAVLVEPVQSRRPDFQPITFLRELRELSRAHGIALIFDEVITGFRVHPGGAQVWCGVDADIVTYGKILGGGLPIGAIAGRSRFLDTIDGGAWNYGDDSYPLVPTTFFGGTFNKNPLSMAAAESILSRLGDQGIDLQRELSDRVAKMANEFNEYCQTEEFPIEVVYFSSLFRFISNGEYSLQRFPLEVDLFFYMMSFKGVYILETRVCFLSTSHTSEDVEFIIRTAKDCLQTLRSGGFFPRRKVYPIPSGYLAEEAYLEPEITASVRSPSGGCENLLLTGATGFLGAYLLKELLNRTSARVHCLVRAGDESDANVRVRNNLSANECWDDAFASRIVALPGDLSQSRLGLPSCGWQTLADQIDAIYHNGALVNSLLPYDKLKPTNVQGTRELLRLAVERKPKTFHYVSSDAVFDAYGYHRQATIFENEPLAHSDSIYGGGYAESKWVADKLVETARRRGVSALIYRPGMITGNTSNGNGRLDDYFARFIKGIIQMQVCPDVDAAIDFTPVDYVARSIVQLSQEGRRGETFHLTHENPITYSQFIDAICGFGFVVRIVPYYEWLETLAKVRSQDDNALYPMLPVFTESTAPIFRKTRLDVTNARLGVLSDVQPCPPLIELTHLYLTRFIEEGFIKRKIS